MQNQKSNHPLDMRKSMIQLAEEEVINGKKVSVRAMNYASRAGKVVGNITNIITNVISKDSEEDKELSTNELAEFITNDPMLWREFQKFVADENVVTGMGTQACLAKFLTEKMGEIKKAYIIHKAAKTFSEKEASVGEEVSRRRNSLFFRRQSMTSTGNTSMTSSKSEVSFFRNQSSGQPTHAQQNATWSGLDVDSVKPKAIVGDGKRTNASSSLFKRLSLAPTENSTMTTSKSELGLFKKRSSGQSTHTQQNATWSGYDVDAVKPKAITDDRKRTNASSSLFRRLSLAPTEHTTITTSKSDSYLSNNVTIDEKKNATWSKLNIYPPPL